jgi:hypothetical protein
MAAYRLDRNAFKGHSADDAADYTAFYKKMKWLERLKVSSYLNSVAFQYPPDAPPRMDKTKFKARAR